MGDPSPARGPEAQRHGGPEKPKPGYCSEPPSLWSTEPLLFFPPPEARLSLYSILHTQYSPLPTFAQAAGRFALLHLGRHAVLPLPMSGGSGWKSPELKGRPEARKLAGKPFRHRCSPLSSIQPSPIPFSPRFSHLCSHRLSPPCFSPLHLGQHVVLSLPQDRRMRCHRIPTLRHLAHWPTDQLINLQKLPLSSPDFSDGDELRRRRERVPRGRSHRWTARARR